MRRHGGCSCGVLALRRQDRVLLSRLMGSLPSIVSFGKRRNGGDGDDCNFAFDGLSAGGGGGISLMRRSGGRRRGD